MALVDNAFYVNYGDGSTTGYFAVGAWVLTTTKVCGNLIRATAPAVGSERVFVCIASTAGTGATGATEPTWVNTRGAKNTDGTVTWQEATGVAALNGDLSTNTPNWNIVKNTAVTLGQVIQNVAGTLILICTTAGTAGNGAEPSWAAFTNAGATTADNTVTWTTLGASFPGWGAPHARRGNAAASTWGQAGNSFFLANTSAETQATSISTTFPGTLASPNFIYSVTTSTVPPATGNLSAGASVSVTAGSNLTLAGSFYEYGVTENSGSGANNSNFTLGGGTSHQKFDTCALNILATGSSGAYIVGAGNNGRVSLYNTPIGFGNASQLLSVRSCQFVWQNTPSAIVGTIPTNIFPAGGSVTLSSVLLQGVDLSAAGAGKTIVQGGCPIFIVLEDCKLGASVTVSGTPLGPGASVDVIRADSGATNYFNSRYWYTGTQTQETTIVRTGGATDGTTLISEKLVTTANSKWVMPFESQPITIWNDSTSAITTLTIYGTTTGGGVPNNDDIWVEVEYLGSASTPQGSFITTTKANNLAASTTTNNSSDASTWGGGGAGNGFKMVVPSFTPGMKGPLNITLKVAKASSTYYIDPRPAISGITVSKSEILAPGVYENELSSGGSSGMLFVPNMDGT